MSDGWQPVLEERVWDKLNEEWPLMDFQQRRLWDIVKIVPEKWSNLWRFCPSLLPHQHMTQ